MKILWISALLAIGAMSAQPANAAITGPINLNLFVVLCTSFPNGGVPITSCQSLPAANFDAYNEAQCVSAARKYGRDMQKTNANAKIEAHCAVPTPPFQAID